MQLRGCGTALVTPFHQDGSLDTKSLAALVEWQISCGIDLLVSCGTTGETPTLDDEEWLEVIRVTVETANGRVPVIAGCTHNSTREACRKADLAAKISGLDALLSANPYYNKPSQEGQFQHFHAIAATTSLPVVLYNIPSRSGVNLEPKTVARLIDEAPTISGVKESSGNLQQITELIHLAPEGFPVFAGDDNIALAAIGVGTAGLISVASNEIPREMAEMVKAALNGEWERARSINRKFYSLMVANFWETSPGPVKSVLAMMGRIEANYRLPLVAPTDATQERLRKMARQLELIA